MYSETSHPIVGILWEASRKHANQSRSPEIDEIDVTELQIDITELESLFCKRKDRALQDSQNPIPEGLRMILEHLASDFALSLSSLSLLFFSSAT
ncbi:hypothetical protein L2E82_48638 [Cichorium intybus]|uniref:Uncharacterized protein n=1 Tax=Cichorium intybus TaxID=13427 RepID=A0ACB8YZ30_CICIN|nr:hypothetical protein L2E82_48638 [Cichorium intybus]